MNQETTPDHTQQPEAVDAIPLPGVDAAQDTAQPHAVEAAQRQTNQVALALSPSHPDFSSPENQGALLQVAMGEAAESSTVRGEIEAGHNTPVSS